MGLNRCALSQIRQRIPHDRRPSRVSSASEKCKGCNTITPGIQGDGCQMRRPVYLDYNATTPLAPEVIDAMRPFMETEFGNPSSSHCHGITPRRAVEAAREQTAALLGCRPDEILFTSGGTESNNHAIKGAVRAFRSRGNHIITSVVEHPAVLEVCRFLEADGVETTYLPVDEQGRVRAADVERAIGPKTILISIMHANNETGSIQPIDEIGELTNAHDIVFHTDAAQSAAKLKIDVGAMGVSLLSLAGHKMCAPKGIGALFIRRGLDLPSFCHGAGQENGRRAGTENVIQIVGMGKACEIALRDGNADRLRMKKLRDRLYDGIAAAVGGVRLNGHPELRLPNTLNLSFYGLDANRILEEIGLEVSASAGAACHSDTVTLSHVLEAMRIPEAWARGSVRFSVGRMTTEAQIEHAVSAVADAVVRLRRQ
jgi:cysteine desulfurase